ncbi:MAG: hypothetical protein LBQ95_04990 [Lachnospiraceae bacterium]|jgi:hypothetical protein|nr:hypothetical protein [Lachnospiraceae bacterium]
MECTLCGAKNSFGAKVCRECGFPLKREKDIFDLASEQAKSHEKSHAGYIGHGKTSAYTDGDGTLSSGNATLKANYPKYTQPAAPQTTYKAPQSTFKYNTNSTAQKNTAATYNTSVYGNAGTPAAGTKSVYPKYPQAQNKGNTTNTKNNRATCLGCLVFIILFVISVIVKIVN